MHKQRCRRPDRWPIIKAAGIRGESQLLIRHPEVAAEGRPRRIHGRGRRPSRLAPLTPQGDG
mgnify:CR=1 FL=1